MMFSSFATQPPPWMMTTTGRFRAPVGEKTSYFNGFTPGQTKGDKIDFVFVEPGVEVLDASIVRTCRDGRYPSDHFPVTARIRLR